MYGIVSLLDQPSSAAVEVVWAELARDFGLGSMRGMPFPHFSYQIATAYDEPRLEAALRAFARTQHRFQVHASGLGIFTGTAPVLYIPVARTAELSAFHAALWDVIAPCASDPIPHYAPEFWMPHITLAAEDLDVAVLSRVIAVVGARDFSWDVGVDHLAYGGGADQDPDAASEVRLRVPLG